MNGLLIVGHGSRSTQAILEFEAVVAMVQQRVDYAFVAGAHMELAEPDIPTTVLKLVNLGAKNITVVPYFLFMGNHIKHDIPEILSAEKNKYPMVQFRFANPIGAESIMVDLLVKRATEAELYVQ